MEDLKELISQSGAQPKDAVKIIRGLFPSFDKTLMSKCMKPWKYGVVLHPEGFRLLRTSYPQIPETVQQITDGENSHTGNRRSGKHKFTCRVQGRLPDAKFRLLQRAISEDGYTTVNEWVVKQVDNYLKEKGCQDNV